MSKNRKKKLKKKIKKQIKKNHEDVKTEEEAGVEEEEQDEAKESGDKLEEKMSQDSEEAHGKQNGGGDGDDVVHDGDLLSGKDIARKHNDALVSDINMTNIEKDNEVIEEERMERKSRSSTNNGSDKDKQFHGKFASLFVCCIICFALFLDEMWGRFEAGFSPLRAGS